MLLPSVGDGGRSSGTILDIGIPRVVEERGRAGSLVANGEREVGAAGGQGQGTIVNVDVFGQGQGSERLVGSGILVIVREVQLLGGDDGVDGGNGDGILSALTILIVLGDSDSGQDTDDGDNDQELDKGEAFALLIEFGEHLILLENCA